MFQELDQSHLGSRWQSWDSNPGQVPQSLPLSCQATLSPWVRHGGGKLQKEAEVNNVSMTLGAQQGQHSSWDSNKDTVSTSMRADRHSLIQHSLSTCAGVLLWKHACSNSLGWWGRQTHTPCLACSQVYPRAGHGAQHKQGRDM